MLVRRVRPPPPAPRVKSRSHKGFWIFSFVLWFFACKNILVSCTSFPDECNHFQNHFTR
nr:MAG TPA: hypothetical protein [Caudoviricetes sp.]